MNGHAEPDADTDEEATIESSTDLDRGRSPVTVDLHPVSRACGHRLPTLQLNVLALDETVLRELLDALETSPDPSSAVAGVFRELLRAREQTDRSWRSTNGAEVTLTPPTAWLFIAPIGERAQASDQDTFPGTPKRRDDRRLVRAVDYLETHLDTALTVGQLAAVAAMSRSAFSRAFRAAYGETAWAYVRRRRVERAMELLCRTAVPIVEVAERCGFASQSHLTSVLHQRLGVTPGAVRGAASARG